MVKEKIASTVLGLQLKNQSIKDIGVRLGFKQAYEFDTVGEVVRELTGQGELVEISRGRYSCPEREKLVIGQLRGNKKGFAFLIREDKGDDLFVPHRSLGGAMHKDRVFCRIVKGDEAEVVSVVERGIKELVGTFYREKGYGFVVADDNSYYSDLFIPPKYCEGIPNKTKVLAEIVSFEKGKNPEAKICEVIGKVGERSSVVLSILKSYGFFNEFSSEAIEEINTLRQSPASGARKDFRHLLTITIDGDDSMDFDDAISLEKTSNGYDLYVHIADVSHFVRTGSVLDEEALKRATSVYFPGSVYPMLPPELSNDICSLNPNEDRLCLSVKINCNKAGDVLDSEIFESVIRSDRRMTYNNVTKILEGDVALREEYADIVDLLENMRRLAESLQKKAFRRGYINFDTKECKILLDKEGYVDQIQPYNYTMSNGIIEQFMVLANEVVAQTFSLAEIPFVYRVHEKPDAEKLANFVQFAKGCGLTIGEKEIHPKTLQALLSEVEDTPIQAILSKVMLRSMQKAKYSADCLGHFGLALQYYCHFTSPIRRYPDLMIHRIIKMYLQGKIDDRNVGKLENSCVEVSKISSERERDAELAERDIDDFYKAEYMSRHIGEEFEGTVSGVTSFGIFVELDNTCEGLARLTDLPQDVYNFDEKQFRMRGTKHSYALGERVVIKVLASSIEDKKVSFSVLENFSEVENERD